MVYNIAIPVYGRWDCAAFTVAFANVFARLTVAFINIIIPLLCGGIPERSKGADCKSAAQCLVAVMVKVEWRKARFVRLTG